MLKLSASSISLEKLKKTIVLFATKEGVLAPHAKEFDKKHGGLIVTALKASRFHGAKEETLTIPTPTIEGVNHVIVAGLGDAAKITSDTWRRVTIHAIQAADKFGAEEVYTVVEKIKGDKTAELAIASAVAEGADVASYRFDRFKTTMPAHHKLTLKKLTIQLVNAEEFKKVIPVLEAQAEGSALARDLVNLPPNIANPDYMVETSKELKKAGLDVKVLGEKEMTKLGFGMLLAVGKGSAQESRLIIMKHMGGKKGDPVKCIVGKGVMFDTGGYNLKGGDNMATMKGDMAGAAAVMGTMKALAKSKAKVNVIGVCGCVMNMVSSTAFLPSDVLTAYNGKTVEIGNTDAEGRLVLGDAMAYMVDKEKPAEIVDIATLTGACMVALGGHYAGLFSNNDDLAKRLHESGETTGERLWRMPIDSGYAVKSKIADLNNNGSRFGGASAAAVFLHNFVGSTPWAHLDIAGVGIGEKIPGVSPIDGASGFGMKLLYNYLTK